MNAATQYIDDELLSMQDHHRESGFTEIPPINEDFEERVQEAQEQLLKLRHQQELLEKQKSELEVLSKQQEKFLHGRVALVEQLTRAAAVMEREAFEAEKRVEQFLHTKDAFARHLEIIESLNPEEWPRNDLRNELARALGAIEEAEYDYQTSMSRMGAYLEKRSLAEVAGGSRGAFGARAGGSREFRQWCVYGLAFTLPLMGFCFIGLLLYLLLAF